MAKNDRLGETNFLLTYTPIRYIIIVQKGEKQMENNIHCQHCRAENKEVQCPRCHMTKERSEEEYKNMINRLNRIAGQIQGIKGMVEKNAYCVDILTQVSAVTAALNSFNRVLLGNHIKTCVAQDIRAGKDETIDELVCTLQKLMR